MICEHCERPSIGGLHCPGSQLKEISEQWLRLAKFVERLDDLDLNSEQHKNMPRMAAVVRVEFELEQGLSEDTATTALAGGTGALKLAIERGITGTAQTGVVQGSVQGNIIEQTVT